MGKKNFNQGLNSLLGSSRELPSDTEIKETSSISNVSSQKEQKKTASSVKAGLKEGETRATLILNEMVIEKLKAISYWDRVSLKTVVDDALKAFIEVYEKNNGKVKSIK
jgi:hypothetical protein